MHQHRALGPRKRLGRQNTPPSPRAWFTPPRILFFFPKAGHVALADTPSQEGCAQPEPCLVPQNKLTGRAQHARKAPSHKLMGEKVKTPSQQSHNPSFHPKPTPKTPPSGSWPSAWGQWQAAAPEVTPWQQRAPRCGVGVPATTQGPPFSPSPRAGKQLNVHLIPG